ncbi:MAG: DNA/RNA non-specific endonuclease [Citrobacter amalonaticus]|nr:DNA/RNA non-specific endonuclease [Citrobacter amalonaticus]
MDLAILFNLVFFVFFVFFVFWIIFNLFIYGPSWAKDLKAGKQVDVQIQPVYSDNSKRPSSFNVTYSVDNGSPTRINIGNAPGGKK